MMEGTHGSSSSPDKSSSSSPGRQRKILDFATLNTLRQTNHGKRIVHCHGVFDILHAGHLAYFESARRFGELLVVTVTSDEFVNKGPGRPYFTSAIRANMLAALEVVDYVVVSRHQTAVPAIEALKPHFYVKGPDYKDRANDPTGNIYHEENAAERGGGKLVFTDDPQFSSSKLLNEFFPIWNDGQQATINQVKEAGGYAVFERVLEKVSKEKVTVIGEPIVDTYVFCVPESISSKSPSVSARYSYEENYAGGSLAIANHLCDFVKEVNLLTTHGGEPYFKELLDKRLDPRVRFIAQELPSVPTPRKTRFIETNVLQRMFEITNLRSDQWLNHSPARFCEFLQDASAVDCLIVADFGHGLFEGPVLGELAKTKRFIGLNVQTNSSNLGFNPFTKHRHFSYLSIDTKEARIAYHDRHTAPMELARRIRADMPQPGMSLSITLGPNGSCYFPMDSKSETMCPAFTAGVVDATGAGDAYFAFTSILIKAGCPDIMVPFLGNIFAGLKTKIIGNKAAVSRAQLIKAVSAILK